MKMIAWRGVGMFDDMAWRQLKADSRLHEQLQQLENPEDTSKFFGLNIPIFSHTCATVFILMKNSD